jgi:hypothetical protein
MENTMNLEKGKLYLCKIHGNERVLRYGDHRKNNDKLWTQIDGGVSVVWYGWRDHKNYRFIAEKEIDYIIKEVDKTRSQV